MSKSKNQNYVLVSVDQFTPLYEAKTKEECKRVLNTVLKTNMYKYSIIKLEDYLESLAMEFEDNAEEIEETIRQEIQYDHELNDRLEKLNLIDTPLFDDYDENKKLH